MSRLPIKFLARDYDYLSPLALGEVDVEGVDLTLDRKTSMFRLFDEPSFDAGELSFAGYAIRTSLGDRTFVGMPFIALRMFRHGCFLIPKGSELRRFKDLEGKRVGTSSWPDTGHTWSRAALRDAGVRIDRIEWWIAPMDDPSYDSWHGRPGIQVPSYVHLAEPGRTCLEMLAAGELDALMCALPPDIFYRPDSPVVRLIPDYRSAEREYYLRTGVYPGHHIFGVRREVLDRHPWVARNLYRALEQSKLDWQRRRRKFSEFTPWAGAEIEEAMRLFGGEDWRPNGVEANRKMTKTLCDELFAQGLISQPLDPALLFADFERVMSE